MSIFNRDEAFINALKKYPVQRTTQDLEVIFSRLHRFEALANLREQNLKNLCAKVRYEWHDANEILYGKEDVCTCWFILLSGSIFIQGSMFLRNTSFGKQIPGTKRRGSQCLVLEPSEMIAIDYPEMHPALHVGSIPVPNMRKHSSSSSKSALDSVAEADNSSAENSPKQNVSRSSSTKMANGRATAVQSGPSALDNNNTKDPEDYYINEDSVSQDGLDQDDQQSEEEEEEHEDSISLHSSSSLIIKDLVTDVLKKDLTERNEDDHDVLLEFTRSLQAFSNMTEPIRRALCKVMVYAHAERAETMLLKDSELLDSWSVIINGYVRVEYLDDTEPTYLYMGESFGVEPNLQAQHHKGTMFTMVDDCQFVCVAQQDYYDVLYQGKENMENVMGEDGVLEMVKEKREIEGGKKGHIVIRGTPPSLRAHLLEENSIDTTYAEDYLLTYRAFCNEPVEICKQLLNWFDKDGYQSKVVRVILLWVNNHFNDFERDRRMLDLLEKFEEKLQTCNKTGECRLFNIACSTKAKSRVLTLSRASNEEDLGFSITGGTENYPIYILQVTQGSTAEQKGLKRGDQLLNVNGQNFEKLNMEKANAILRKNTDLTLTVKTNLFAFKEMMTDLKNPNRKKDKKKMKNEAQFISQISTMQPTKPSRMSSVASDGDMFDGKAKKAGTLGRRALNKMNKVRSKMFTGRKEQTFNDYLDSHKGMISETDTMAKDDSFLSALRSGRGAATIDGPHLFRQAAAHSSSNPDLLDPGAYLGPEVTEAPEDVIKVFKADQTYRFVFVSQDTTAEEAVRSACKEFGISADNYKNYSLCRVTVQNETFVKQSKLPEKWSKLSEIPLSARYYLKNDLESEQLLPDENIPDVLKDANYSFLDLNCFEVALHLTLQDYEFFKTVEQTDFIDDLFHLNEENLTNFKAFENLVNRELFWVVSTICLEPNVLRRSKMIKHFTKIAHYCKALKNLNSTFAIISGLGYRAVSRMKSSWEKVPAKVQRTFDDLQSLMDPSRNMSKYRTLLNELTPQPPVLPYIPVIKKDLTFLHLGNDTKVDGLINFEKMRMIGREVRNVCRLCSADSSQIISSAIAHHPDAERPSSNIYHTLTRKGRRSSFNNARKMYEDAVNARRVKQYMQQLEIESDEDKLLEMSKQVEPAPVSSGQPKRRNVASESPSRSSKTLPGGPNSATANAMKRASQGRNNSEPQISLVPGALSQNPRKKNPVSSLPKFGTSSPQAIRKLLALSEESGGGGDGGSSGSSKRGSLEQRRSGSTSSRELSPATSPYLSPRRDIGRSKGSISSSDSGHSIAHENTNRNNNRGRHDIQPSLSRSAIHSKHLSHPPSLSSYSNSSSARSSIASSSSLGVSTSSLNTHLGLSSSSSSHSLSPRSSPNSISSSSRDHRPTRTHRTTFHNSPIRSSSSSSADTVKSAGAGRSQSDRPVIMQNRSGSFGALSVTTVKSDRQLPPNSGDRRSAGYTTAALAAANKHHLILPNHPQIPRSPSMDSGVVSIGSLSADSTRFLHTEPGEIFQGQAHHSTASLNSSEGYASQQSLQHIQGGAKVDSPVMRHRLRNIQMRQDDSGKSTTRESEVGEATTAHSAPTEQSRRNPNEQPDKDDDIKQTFLSGSRGRGDAPLRRDKDPWPIEAMMPPGVRQNWQTSTPGDNMAPIGENRNSSPNAQHNVPPPRLRDFKGGGGGDVIDGRYHHHAPQKLVIPGTGPEIQQYYERLRSQERPSPPASLNFRMAQSSQSLNATTPDSILGDKYPPEFPHQRQRMNRSFDGVPLHYHSRENSGQQMLCERHSHSQSFSGVPPGYLNSPGTPNSPITPTIPMVHRLSSERSGHPMHHPGMSPNLPVEYPSYPSPGAVCTKPGCKCPASRQIASDPRNHRGVLQAFNFNLHGRTAMPSDPRALVPVRREGEDVYLSDFGNPDPRTFMRVPPEHRHPRTPDETRPAVPPFHCPKHGSPFVSPHKGYAPPNSQSLHGVPEFSSLPLPPPLSNAPDTPTSHYRAEMHYEYRHVHNEIDGPDGHHAMHTRSSSDISLHTNSYELTDQYNKNIGNTSLEDIRYMNDNNQAYQRPIVDAYTDSTRYNGGQFQDVPQTFQSSSTQGNSSTPKTQQPSTPRRKSCEWAVTDLDKETNQQAMQVWSGSSSSSVNPSPNVSAEIKPTVPSNPQSDPVAKTKRKKPPPPLPPQRNSSYGVTRQLRLSSSTLSPLSSPPNSPTTPLTHTKISLNETHPQLVVKTMPNGIIPNLDIAARTKQLTLSNGVPPQMTQPNRKEEQLSGQNRTLPSYTEAISHISSKSPYSPTNTKLPSYQAYQEMRDNKEQTSQV